MSKQVLVFDLDGTLVDSIPDICASLNRTLASAGRRSLSPGKVVGFLGSGAPLFVRKALEETGGALPDEEIDRLVGYFLEDYSNCPVAHSVLYPDVHSTLDKLRSRDYVLAICTNKPSALVPPVLEHFRLTQYFPTIVCGDEVRNRKPHKDHIVETVNRALTGAPAIMVGDNVNDFVAARAAGIKSIAVSYGYAQCHPDELGANAVIDRLAELIPMLRSFHDSARGPRT